jgi:hypothetical protein
MLGMVGCSLIVHRVNALVLPVPWVVGFCLYIEIEICILRAFLAPFWPHHHSFLVVWATWQPIRLLLLLTLLFGVA